MTKFWCANFDSDACLHHGIHRKLWLMQYQYADDQGRYSITDVPLTGGNAPTAYFVQVQADPSGAADVVWADGANDDFNGGETSAVIDFAQQIGGPGLYGGPAGPTSAANLVCLCRRARLQQHPRDRPHSTTHPTASRQ